MKQDNLKIGIVGLGVMGCSLAYSLSKSSNISKIIGFDIKKEHQKIALDAQLIDEVGSFDDFLITLDIVFLVIPSFAIVELISQIKSINKDTTLIDFASVKSNISQAIPSSIRSNFVLSHPMCGNEKAGPNGYEKDLYTNKTMIICDKQYTDSTHLNRALFIYSFLDMHIVYMNSDVHDTHIGFISHLPHIVSFCLANSVLNQEDPSSIVDLRGGGFESMSRLAKSSSFLWRDIFEANSENISIALEEYEKELRVFKEYLAKKDWHGIEKWIQKSNKLQDIL